MPISSVEIERIGLGGRTSTTDFVAMGNMHMKKADGMAAEASGSGWSVVAAANEYKSAGECFVMALGRQWIDEFGHKTEAKMLAKIVSGYEKAAKMFEKADEYGKMAKCYNVLHELMVKMGRDGAAAEYAVKRCIALKKDGQTYIADQIIRSLRIGHEVRDGFGTHTHQRAAFASAFRTS